MPIFDYVCCDCSHHFEAFVQGSKLPECPACHSVRLEQQLSVFAVGGRTSRNPTPACPTCGDPRGPGSCPTN